MIRSTDTMPHVASRCVIPLPFRERNFLSRMQYYCTFDEYSKVREKGKDEIEACGRLSMKGVGASAQAI